MTIETSTAKPEQPPAAKPKQGPGAKVLVGLVLLLLVGGVVWAVAPNLLVSKPSATAPAAAPAAATMPTQQPDGTYFLEPGVEYTQARVELEYLTNDGGPLGDFAPAGTWRARAVAEGGFVITGAVTLDGVSDPAVLAGEQPVFYIGSFGTMGWSSSASPTLPLNEAAAAVYNSSEYWQPTAAQQAAISELD